MQAFLGFRRSKKRRACIEVEPVLVWAMRNQPIHLQQKLLTFQACLLAFSMVGCQPSQPSVNPNPEVDVVKTPAAVPALVPEENFVEEELINPISEESTIGQLARLVVGLEMCLPVENVLPPQQNGCRYRSPNEVVEALGLSKQVWSNTMLPTPDKFYPVSAQTRPGWPAWDVDVDGVKLVLSMQFKPGTWESPRGNSLPRFEPPEVIGVVLTGPGQLSLKTPEDAEKHVFDFDDETRRYMHFWGTYCYFEQGREGRDWMVAKLKELGPFHTTAAQRKVVEDLLIELADAVIAGAPDVQVLLKEKAGKYEVAPQRYNLGAATITSSAPSYFHVVWSAPTKIPRFFEHVKVDFLATGFAHDYGAKSQPVQLKNFKLDALNYYIRDEDSREAEMGHPNEATFRSLSFHLDRK